MNSFFYASALGWLASIFFACESVLPYLLRTSALSRWLGIAGGGGTKPYFARMRAHYWIGYALFPMALVHAWIPMARGGARGANMTGLWLATGALLLLLFQLVLGLSLRRVHLPERTKVRRMHYWLMVAIAASVLAHIWLNG